MTLSVRRAMLGIAAGIGLWIGTAHAAVPRSADRGTPSGALVLHGMLAAAVNVRTVHGSGVVQGPAGMLNLSGDCVGLVHRSHGAVHLSGTHVMSWVHGFLRHTGTTSTINVHLISVQTGTGPLQAWSRSPSSGNRWRIAGRGAAIAEVYTGDICFPLYARANLGTGHAPWKNLGAQSVNGHSAWHIQSRSTTKGVASTVTNLYVDQSSHHLLRYDITDTPARTHQAARTVMDFSAFNAKLNIKPPKVGATSP